MNPEALRLLRNVAQRLFASIIADISPSDDQLLVVKERDIVDIVIRNLFDEFILPIARHLATVDFKRPNLAARPTPLISITVLTKHISGCIQPEIPPVSFRLISLDPNAIDSLLIGLSVKIIARNTKIINATAQALLSLLAIICNDWLECRLLADHFAAYPHSAMFGDFPTGINTSGFAALKNNRTSRDVYGWLSEYEKWRATVIRPLLKAFCASDEDCFESEGGGGQIFGAAADIPGILNSLDIQASDISLIAFQLKRRVFSLSPFCQYPLPFLLRRLEPDAKTRAAASSLDAADCIGFIKKAFAKLLFPATRRRLTTSEQSIRTVDNSSSRAFKLRPADRKSILCLRQSTNNDRPTVWYDQNFQFLFTRTLICSPPLTAHGCEDDCSHNVHLRRGRKSPNGLLMVEEIGSPCFMDYRCLNAYDFGGTDQSLETFIRKHIETADEVCNSMISGARCGAFMGQHKCTFAHGPGRIHISFERPCEDLLMYDNKFEQSSEISGDYGPLWMWTECEICKQPTARVQMSVATSQYSFVKYLELLLYDPLFTVHCTALCRPPLHRIDVNSTSSGLPFSNSRLNGCMAADADETLMKWGLSGAHPAHRQNILRYFQLGDRCISFRFEPLALLEVTLPPSEHFDSRLAAMDLPPAMSAWKSDSTAPSALLQLNQILEKFWFTVEECLTLWEKSLSGRQRHSMLTISNEADPKILADWKMLRQQLLCEKARINENLLPLIGMELMRLEKSKQGSGANGTTRDFWSSPIVALRLNRKALLDKLLCIERELKHFQISTIDRTGGQLQLVDYRPREELQAIFSRPYRNLDVQWSVEDPCSLVSFALASADTRDLLGILEEAYELAVEASSSANDFVDDLEVDVSAPPKTKNDLPGSRISAELERVSQALIDGRYPRNFWHRSGRWVYQSSITDGAHIEFKCFYSSGSSSAGAKEVGATDNLLWSTTIHYAYFFERMRSNASITLENYIRSLSQSEQWQPIGGKSASRFFRTKDDRFIVKQVGLKRKWWSSIWSSRGSNHQQSASIATSSPPAGENLIADQEESRAILSVLLKYLDYTTGGQDEISLIVKTFGSYQVTINNTEQLGISVNNNLHLLIMDNLFYDRPNISRKFDLKGIYSRTAAPRTSESNESSSIPAGKKPQLFGNLQNFISLKTTDGVAKAESERPETPQSITLLDANWIQSLHQPLEAKVSGDMSLPLSFGQVAPTTVLFLHPHSRRLLDEAVANDTDFLARANIIDYSMLVGVDLETGELIVGLVDYLIEYNTWKALENKSKVTLKTLENTISTANLVKTAKPTIPAAESVTVQPPERYRQRFLKAMEKYFLSVPDRWTVDSTAANDGFRHLVPSLVKLEIMPSNLI